MTSTIARQTEAHLPRANVCSGNHLLGTACGDCFKCRETLRAAVKTLREVVDSQRLDADELFGLLQGERDKAASLAEQLSRNRANLNRNMDVNTQMRHRLIQLGTTAAEMDAIYEKARQNARTG